MRTTIPLAVACALLMPAVARGAVINGGFEAGNTSGWTAAGSAKALTAAFGVTPSSGTYQGYIESTGNFTAPAAAVVASLGVDGPDVVALGAGTPVNGSGISQDVTVAAGDTLTFDWNFLSDELNESATFNDFAFLVVDGSAFLLASRNSSTFDTVSPPAGFDGQTGWLSGSYIFATAGTYKIGFGVFNVGDAGHNSVLLLDAILLPVPEPATLTSWAVGLAAVVVFGRRRLRR